MHIAVIGTGIAGLTSAWLLKRSGHEVSLFEKQSSLGMASHGIQISTDSASLSCDVPSRMFNPLLWPNLSKLYDNIGVESANVDPSKSFCHFAPERGNTSKAILKLNDSFDLNLVPQLLLQPTSRKIVTDIGKMMASAENELATMRDSDDKPAAIPNFKDYLDRSGYTQEFIYQFLYPALSSTVCTCSYSSLDLYPADILLSAMQMLIGAKPLQRTVHGTQHTANLLSQHVDSINLNTTVSQVCSSGTKAYVELDNQGIRTKQEFDHVIVATQANSAASFLGPEFQIEKELLQKLNYEDVSVAIHRDERLMPPRHKDWATFNFLSQNDNRAAMCSIWLNQFYPNWGTEEAYFQTIMPLDSPRPDMLIATAKLQRPTVTSSTQDDIEQLLQLQQRSGRRVWFCGSYASPGIPLLESGVVSALRLGKQLGCEFPNPCKI